jgi:hypothetical protein
MIIYDLACAQGHRFEGWFGSGEDFVQQQAKGLVRCPVCDVGEVQRVPSARVSVPKGTPSPAPSAPAVAATSEGAIAGIPAELIAKLREIVRNTENVGSRFPEEARKIHYEEVPARAIRGQASAEEAQSLRDEGIDFAPIPPALTVETH